MKRRSFLLAGLGATSLLPTFVAAAPIRPLPARRPKSPLRLNRNENPLGLSDAARRAIADGMDDANRYPIELRPKLVEALAAKHRVKPEQIVLGNGSTEILQMAVQAAAGPELTAIVPDPTFEDVLKYADASGVRMEKVPLRPTFEHDLERMEEAANKAKGPVLVYICNPNNPTGTLTPSVDLDRWIQAAPERFTFTVDEAYCDYVEDAAYWSAQKSVDTHPNVIVVHTFSKIYAMAGMRLGYAIAHPKTAERLARFAAGSNVNHLAVVAGLASLGDDGFARQSLAVNREAREVLYRCLNELGVEYLRSQTNFVMHRIQGDLDTYIKRMKEREIWVGRPFPPMLNYSRVSIGVPEEMRAFSDALRSFRQQRWV
jgi:histidinol-phosphate aminotransferase